MNNLKEKFNSIYEKRKERCECAVEEMKTDMRKQLIEWFESDKFAQELETTGVSNIYLCDIMFMPNNNEYYDGLYVDCESYDNGCTHKYLIFLTLKEMLTDIFTEIGDDGFELKMNNEFSVSGNVKKVATIKIKE